MLTFGSVKQRFYIIVGMLLMLFCIGYAALALSLDRMSLSSERGQSAASTDMAVHELKELFWKLRFCEKAVQAQNDPDADRQFGIAIQDIRKKMSAFDPGLLRHRFSQKTGRISDLLSQYEDAFNRLMQFKTDLRMNRTRMDSTYRSLSSAILMGDVPELLKPLFNLNRFLGAYLKSPKDSAYKALRMVFGFFRNKVSASPMGNGRVSAYMAKFDDLLTEDFRLEKEIRAVNREFDHISLELMELFTSMSRTAESLSMEAHATGERLREKVYFWLAVSGMVSFVSLLLIFHLIARAIVSPIRQLSGIISQVRAGNDEARFVSDAKDEIAELGFAFNHMLDTVREHRQGLERLVAARTAELNRKNLRLNETLEEVEKANAQIMESLEYAEKIQRSLLSGTEEEIGGCVPDSFFIWMPRDLVGGDIFFADTFVCSDGSPGFLVAVIDCTGHGVPGAFLTMIASSALQRIVKDDGCREPAQILRRLNLIVKTTLHLDSEHAASDDLGVARFSCDDGMDAAVCSVRLPSGPGANPEAPGDAGDDPAVCLPGDGRRPPTLTFAGARIPLFCVRDRKVDIVKGDRQSIGYRRSRRSDMNFEFTDHVIRIRKGMCFYMATDGFEDQMGDHGKSRFGRSCFGRKRFVAMLRENAHLPFETQREIFVGALDAFRGDRERQDDVTMAGFGFGQKKQRKE